MSVHRGYSAATLHCVVAPVGVATAYPECTLTVYSNHSGSVLYDHKKM